MTAVNWGRATFDHFERRYGTSTAVASVVVRVGQESLRAYVKPLGNPQGPHVLACELVGSKLARWFGLPTFDFGIINLEEADEIPMPHGMARPGPAFAAKAEAGRQWSGNAKELEKLVNPKDLPRLVVFDTWTLNCDRHPPDLEVRKSNRSNVFLSEDGIEPGRRRLTAMDHTHCFTCGRYLAGNVATIERVKDERIYGLFPAFRNWMKAEVVKACEDRLAQVDEGAVYDIVESVPSEWEVSQQARDGLVDLITQRAAFLSGRVCDMLRPYFCPAQLEFPFIKEMSNGGT